MTSRRSVQDIFNFDKPYTPNRSSSSNRGQYDDLFDIIEGNSRRHHGKVDGEDDVDLMMNHNEDQSSIGNSSVSEHEGCHDPYIDLNGNVIDTIDPSPSPLSSNNATRPFTKRKRGPKQVNFNMHLSQAVSSKNQYPTKPQKTLSKDITISAITNNVPIIDQSMPSPVALDEIYERQYSARLEKIFPSSSIPSSSKTIVPSQNNKTILDYEDEDDDFDDNRPNKRRKVGIKQEYSSNDDHNEEDNDDDNDELTIQPFPTNPNQSMMNIRHEKKECFLCAWCDKFHDGIKAQHIQKLDMIIDECYGRYSNEDLAQQVHLYFKEHVYDPESGMVMLEKSDVLEHIEGLHSLNAKMYIGETIREWKKIAFVLKSSLFRQDGSFDYKTIIALEKCQKMITGLYKSDPLKFIFNEGISKDDMNKLGAYHQLMPLYTHKEQRLISEQRKRSNVKTSSNEFR